MAAGQKELIKKIGFIVLVVGGLALAALLAFNVFKNKDKLLGSSLLSVSVANGTAQVFVDGVKIGDAPIDSREIGSGTHTIKLSNGSKDYEASVPFAPNSHVILVRDLGVGKLFSSGQLFWLDSKDLSSKISVVSDPAQATVYIDDQEVGKTPYSSSLLTEGGYDLKIAKEGYEPQTARVQILKDFKLNVSVQLFLRPAPETPVLIPATQAIYDLSSDNNELLLDVPSWVAGVIYANKTSLKYSYFLDYMGNVYTQSGNQLSSSEKVVLKAGDTLGYLGRKSDNGLSKEAKDALQKVFGGTAESSIGGAKKVKVGSTPTGWLRIRSAASLDGAEIGRLNSGDVVTVIEEKPGWVKISFGDNKTGWVSSAYVTPVTEP